MKKLIAGIFGVLMMAASLVGCNTVQGAAEDVKAGATGVQNASEEVQHSM